MRAEIDSENSLRENSFASLLVPARTATVADGFVERSKLFQCWCPAFVGCVPQVLVEPAMRRLPCCLIRLLKPVGEPLPNQRMGVEGYRSRAIWRGEQSHLL